MNRFRHLIAATVVASLAACSTVLPTAHSGFLSDYTALAGGPDAAAASGASADRIDPARVTVDAVASRSSVLMSALPVTRQATASTVTRAGSMRSAEARLAATASGPPASAV